MPQTRRFRLLGAFMVLALAVSICALNLSTRKALAATNQIKGVNWADQRDNFVNGVLYPSGLSSSDSYSSAATVADRVVGQLYSITGGNTVRIPINEPTVANYWGTYTGAIDTALTKGNVIFAYWAYSGGKPASMSSFDSMWDKVISKYGSNSNAYFEVINEPYGYNNTDLDNFYYNWLNRYSSIPRGRVILDGAGDAQNVAAVGNDGRLANTLLAVHDYSFFAGCSPSTSESYWESQFASEVGGYASRTVATEYGAPMSSGSKCGVNYGPLNYSQTNSGNYFIAFMRGITNELRTLGMGSVYWPGLRDGDWYSLTSKSGSGSGINLSLVNASGLSRIQYAWGVGTGGGGGGGGGGGTGSYVRIQNVATGLYIDGAGSTTNGSAAKQWAGSSSTNQEWTIVPAGSYVEIQNRSTGLYLDGMGRTTNGSDLGQWSGSGSNNQQWSEVTSGGHVTFQNRATGLFIDGMGRTSNGSTVGQWSGSSSGNQQWTIVAAS